MNKLSYRFPPFSEEIEFTENRPLFRLYLNGDQENPAGVLKPGDFGPPLVETAGETTSLTYRKSGLTVTVKLTRRTDQVTGSISLESDGAFTLRRVQFPCVAWHFVSHVDSLLMSTPWGDNIQRPTKTISEFCLLDKSYWVHDYIKRGRNEVIYTYPSILSMQYMVLHNKARSLYLACYGTGSDTITLNAKVLGRMSLELSVNHYPFLERGSWQSPECAFSLLEGDWHRAADLYSSRMKGKFRDPDVPSWMKDPARGWHGWAEIMMHREGEEPLYRYKDLPDIYRRVRETGLNTLQIAGWARRGFDTMYPDFDVDPELGTEEELRQAMDEIKAMGGHAILYTNGRLVDPRSRFWQEGGSKAVCVDEKGRPYIERYNTSAEFRIACPACGEYREHLAEKIGRICGSFGAHACQVDQISCNFGYFCFDKSHPHPTPSSNYLPGVEAQLRKIRETHKSINPDFFVWCEGCHERFGQFYDVEQGHGEEFTWQMGESMPEQFKYHFPGRIVTGMSKDLQQLCHSYCQGKPFDVQYATLIKDPVFTGLLKSFIETRKKYPEYFLLGRFKDNVGLTVNDGVRVFGIENGRGEGLLVNLWIRGAQPGQACEAYLKNPRPGKRMKPVFPASLSLSSSGQWLELNWQGPVATVIFE